MICPFCNTDSVERIAHQDVRRCALGEFRWRCQNCGRLVDPALSPSLDILRLPRSDLQDQIFFEQASANEVTWDEFTKLLRNSIDTEDKTEPLTDEELAKKLLLDGLDVSAHAIMKYRRKLGIPEAPDRCDKSGNEGN